MEWGFLTALGGVQGIPFAGICAFLFFLMARGTIVFARDRDETLRQMREAHREELGRVREDRDERLEGKNDEIARLTLAHDAEVARAREAEQEWRNAWRESQAIAAEVRSQNRDLIDSLYYVRKVVGALPSVKGGDTE